MRYVADLSESRDTDLSEELEGPLVHAWRYAAKEAPRKRRRDRVKYA